MPQNPIGFGSDNEAPVREEILQAIAEVNRGAVPSYGEDRYTTSLLTRFREVFETDLAVFPVTTGTGANGICLSQLLASYGAVMCHENAHINLHECGAPEFFSGGKLLTISGNTGKIDASDLERALERHENGRYHANKVCALSLTQATEYGTAYSLEELGALSSVARGHGLMVHMDGARFANAVAFLGCSPAEASWRAGVDILSFGSSKNGTMNAESIVCFRPELTEQLQRRLKQSGHLPSKMRYLSAQLLAYLQDERWINWAGEANQMAHKLAEALEENSFVDIVFPVQANILIIKLPESLVDYLLGKGVTLYPWHEIEGHYRLVLSNQNSSADVSAFREILAGWRPGA